MNSTDYRRIAEAIRFLESHAAEQPSLREVSSHVALSPYHFQRLFKRWAGITPKQFLQALTLSRAKQMLEESSSVLDTAFDAGLSGTGRLHDLFVTLEGTTPGEFKRGGLGVLIRYGYHESPFGEILLALTERGICHLGFVEPGCRDEALETLKAAWPRAEFLADEGATSEYSEVIFAPKEERPEEPLPLLVKGTNFQLQVWRALMSIPEGALISYGELARRLGKPTAHRAVASAVAKNPVGYLIPCHRVLRSTGALGGYRWGLERKRALLARELGDAR